MEVLARFGMGDEKAFDKIKWKYLMEVLARFVMCEKFLTWLKLTYSDPTVQITANNLIFQPFNLCRGTQQGCPLSPLLN